MFDTCNIIAHDNVLYFYISTIPSMCAVLNMSVFCSFLMSCFPGIFLNWFWDFCSFLCYYCYHFCCYIPHELYDYCNVLYFIILSASFLITFLSREIATSVSVHVSSSLSGIKISDLTLLVQLSIYPCWFRNMAAFPPWVVSTNFGICSYKCSLSKLIIIIIIIITLWYATSLLCFLQGRSSFIRTKIQGTSSSTTCQPFLRRCWWNAQCWWVARVVLLWSGRTVSENTNVTQCTYVLYSTVAPQRSVFILIRISIGPCKLQGKQLSPHRNLVTPLTL